MKIYITSCATGSDTYRHKEMRLRELQAAATPQESVLVEDPDEADIILVGNLRDENHWEVVLNDRLLRKYADKCFGISDHDTFPLLIHGIYTSARRSHYWLGRARSGSYALNARKNLAIPTYAGQGLTTDKRFLCCFVGNCETHPVRRELAELKFKRADVYMEDTAVSFPFFKREDWAIHNERLHKYCQNLCESKFALCPRGYGTASFRLFEAMELGVCPVIIADDWLPPAEVTWTDFALFLHEDNVENLEALLLKNEHRWEELGRKARAAFEAYFSESKYFNYLVRQCRSIQANQVIPEGILWHMRRIAYFSYRFRRSRWAQRLGLTPL